MGLQVEIIKGISPDRPRVVQKFWKKCKKNPEATAVTTEIPILYDLEFLNVNKTPMITITKNRNGFAYCSIFFD